MVSILEKIKNLQKKIEINAKVDLRLLIIFPVLTYIISYLYLAYYHGEIFIFNTIVHEGGRYTLLLVMFYASHFLGHIPLYTMLAFLFIGSYLCLTGFNFKTYSKKKTRTLFILLILFLTLSFFLSLGVFGREDTFAFIGQQKQGVEIYAEGGSWNLHLPSSMLLFLLIPVYIYIVKAVFGRNIEPNLSGLLYISLGFICFFLFTFFFNENIVDSFFSIWRDPRYLAHSVRELLTFPITYFPIPLYFILRREKRVSDSSKRKQSRNLKYFIACLAIFFLLGLFYQSYISLTEGIGNIAQKPDFAKGGKLGVPYLLASHYFEHFLDTVYFSLLCLVLYGFVEKKKSITLP